MSYEDVALWLEKLQLTEIKSKLQDAMIDSKHLFMLADTDLAALGITSPILQARLLQEINQLKQTAKGIYIVLTLHLNDTLANSQFVQNFRRCTYAVKFSRFL